MEKQYEYNGYKYWVKVDPTIIPTTTQVYFIAYVNDEKPGALLYGTPVRDGQGNIILFETELSAFVNANAIKQGELGRR